MLQRKIQGTVMWWGLTIDFSSDARAGRWGVCSYNIVWLICTGEELSRSHLAHYYWNGGKLTA